MYVAKCEMCGWTEKYDQYPIHVLRCPACPNPFLDIRYKANNNDD